MTATKRKPKPITAHPLFPVVTALWFATFFGLGSFAVAPAVLEGPVVALGLPALIPAAAPPLGFTARVMLALAMLIAGGVTGYLVGRRLGPRAVADAPRKRAAAGFSRRNSASLEGEAPRRPLNPVEDLDEPLVELPLADPAPFRRRSLSLADEGQLHMPSELAPLPGSHLPWEHDTGPAASQAVPHVAPEDPLALDTLLENAQAPIENPVPVVDADVAAQDVAALDVAANCAAAFAAPAAAPAPAPVATETETESENTRSASLMQAPVAGITPLERAPLESLGLVQMIERLALAISRRSAPRRDASVLEELSFAPSGREIAPAFASSSPQPVVIATAHAEPVTERVVRLHPAPTLPAAPAELLTTAADEEDDVPGLDRFLRVSKASEPVPAEASPAEPEVAEDRYPSLLDMGPAPHRHEAVRIKDGLGIADLPQSDSEIEPVVVFPGQDSRLLGASRPFERPSILAVPGSPLAAPGRAAPSAPSEQLAEAGAAGVSPAAVDPEEADRALRAALATLQRMTAQG